MAVAPVPTEITFADYAAEWMEGRPDLAVRTVELYRWLLRRHVDPTFGDALWGRSPRPPSAVRLWHASIARQHPTTAAKAYRLLSSIMRTAVTDEVIVTFGRPPLAAGGPTTSSSLGAPCGGAARLPE